MKRIVIIAIILVAFLWACDPNDINNIFITRDNYVATWNCNDTEVPITKNAYSVTIELDPGNSSRIIIKNFHQFGSIYYVNAVVAGKSFTIESQTVAGETVHGDGTLVDNNKIECTYYTNDGADLKKFNAIYTK